MKTSNWSLAGMSLGALFSLFSGIRYFIVYPDLDKALVYVLIGGVIIAISWLYNKYLELSNTLISIEDYLSVIK